MPAFSQTCRSPCFGPERASLPQVGTYMCLTMPTEMGSNGLIGIFFKLDRTGSEFMLLPTDSLMLE